MRTPENNSGSTVVVAEKLLNVRERISRVRDSLRHTETQQLVAQNQTGTEFSKQSAPLFNKEFNQDFNKFRQESGK